MKWRLRTDNARRTKGDPAPTYAELEAAVAELARKLAEALAANGELHDRNERLHTDMAAMRERLPRIQRLASEGICGSKAGPGPLGAEEDPTEVCVLPYGHGSDWHEAEGGMRWTYRLAPVPADPDPARPYIPTYEEEQR